MGIAICTIKKSQREKIRIGPSEFMTEGTKHDMVYARTLYDDGANYRPDRWAIL